MSGALKKPEGPEEFSDLDEIKVTEHTYTGADLAATLLRPDVQANFEEMFRGTELDPHEKRGIKKLAALIAADTAGKDTIKEHCLDERVFNIYASHKNPKDIKVGAVTRGDYSSTGIDIGQDMDKGIDIVGDFVLMNVHSEPGISSAVVSPSGYNPELRGGDLLSLTALTDEHLREGNDIRSLAVLTRPDEGKAMILQVADGFQGKITRETLAVFEQRHFDTQEEVNTALREIGINAGVVDLPFNPDQLLAALKPFEFTVRPIPKA